jgi:hypothetical protein
MTGPTPSSRRDPCLGETAAALVDGALDHDARDRALAHVTRCPTCRTEVDAQRRLKARLSALGGPQCPSGLAGRLAAIPEVTPAPREPTDKLPEVTLVASFHPPAARFRRGTGQRPADARDQGRRPSGAGRPASGPRSATRPGGGVVPRQRTGGTDRRHRRLALTAAGGLAAFALSLAVVVAAGEPDGGGGDPVTPPVGTFTVEHGRSSDGLPGNDPAVGVVDVSTSSGR